MRHHRFTVRFGRQRSHYKATLRDLAIGLIKNKAITTTKAKAKQASRLVEKLVTIAKENTVVNQRKAYKILCNRRLVSILFNEIAPLFRDRNGGYTRIMLLGKRRGDNAQMAILEFVEKPKPKEPTKEKKPRPEKEKTEQIVKEDLEKEKVSKEKELIDKKKEEEKQKRPLLPDKEKERPRSPDKKTGFFKRFFWKKSQDY